MLNPYRSPAEAEEVPTAELVHVATPGQAVLLNLVCCALIFCGCVFVMTQASWWLMLPTVLLLVFFLVAHAGAVMCLAEQEPEE